MKHLLRWFFRLLLLVVLLAAGFLGYMTLTDFAPPARLETPVLGAGESRSFASGDTLQMLVWNIGYAGLGAEMDFFFDGGTKVRPSEDLNQKYLEGISNFLAGQSKLDFLLLQEVDVHSRRSWHSDQSAHIAQLFPNHAHSFATNYKTAFVPQPLSKPYGKVNGGLQSLSPHKPQRSTRFQLAPDAGWPTGLFMLDRCFLSWRYPLQNNRELVVVNLHLSAYDDGGVRQNQMDSLAAFLLAEQAAGNVVIAGGDWNQLAPGKPLPKPEGANPLAMRHVPESYPAENWQWAVPAENTNRWLSTPYKMGETVEVCIDYFLASPGVEIISTQRNNQGFVHSDHEPVLLRLVLP